MGEAKNQSAIVVGKTERRRIPKKLKKVLSIAVIVIVLLSGLTICLVHYNDEQKAKQAAKTICETSDSGAIFKNAVANLGPTHTTLLKSVLGQIQSLKSYQQDPNCLYIAVTYYVDIQDPINSQAYLTKFNKVYTANSLSPQLTNYQSVSEMRAQVAELQVIAQDTAKNSIGIPQP